MGPRKIVLLFVIVTLGTQRQLLVKTLNSTVHFDLSLTIWLTLVDVVLDIVLHIFLKSFLKAFPKDVLRVEYEVIIAVVFDDVLESIVFIHV